MNRLAFIAIFTVLMIITLSAYGLSSNDVVLRHQNAMLNAIHNLPSAMINNAATRNVPFLDHMEFQSFVADSWQNQERLFFAYDESWRITSLSVEAWDTDAIDWVNSNRYVYSYTDTGLTDHVDLEAWDGTDWVIAARMNYSYENNKLESIVAYNIVGEETEEYLHLNHFYDAVSGRLDYMIMMISFDFSREWISLKSSFEYDAQGRVNTTYTYVQDDAEQWVPADKSTIAYHPQDTSTYEDFYTQFINQYSFSDYEIFPSSSLFYLDEEVEYYYIDSSWALSYKTQYAYNQDMQVINDVSYSFDGTLWTLDSRNDYVYPEQLNILDTWTSSYYSAGQLYPEDRKVYHWVMPSANNDPLIPNTIMTLGAYPNPFNPSTTISYELSKAGNVAIEIYNLRGQKVHSLLKEYSAKGVHSVKWDGKDDAGRNVGSGLYIVILKSAGNSKSTKIILFK